MGLVHLRRGHEKRVGHGLCSAAFVLAERLQQQRRQPGTIGRSVQLPLHTQPFTKTHLLDRQLTLCKDDFLPQRDRLGRVRQRAAKQFGQIFQHGFSLRRLGAHQGNRTVEGVE